MIAQFSMACVIDNLKVLGIAVLQKIQDARIQFKVTVGGGDLVFLDIEAIEVDKHAFQSTDLQRNGKLGVLILPGK
jgi:hypothetical protein